MLTTCPVCEHLIPHNETQCPDCRSRREHENFCTTCGHDLRRGPCACEIEDADEDE